MRRVNFHVALPLVLSVTSFVLAMLCIFAGSRKGFMEDYNLISLNMSTFGHNLIPTSTSSSASASSTSDSIASALKNAWDDLTHKAGSEIASIENDAADKLAAELGISQWYSLHVLDGCEGNFAPNATAPRPHFNVTNCTASQPGYQLNLTAELDRQLSLGPVHVSLADLGWDDSIQDGVHHLNQLTRAVFVLYAIAAAACGLAMLLSAVTVCLLMRRAVALANWALAALAAFVLFLGSIIVTIGANEAASTINHDGRNIGISAAAGKKFITLTWIAFALMFVASVFWVVEFFRAWRVGRRRFGEKY